MSIATVQNISLSPGTSHAFPRNEATLASATEELARLRIFILLTAGWAAAETEGS